MVERWDLQMAGCLRTQEMERPMEWWMERDDQWADWAWELACTPEQMQGRAGCRAEEAPHGSVGQTLITGP